MRTRCIMPSFALIMMKMVNEDGDDDVDDGDDMVMIMIWVLLMMMMMIIVLDSQPQMFEPRRASYFCAQTWGEGIKKELDLI